MGRNIVKRDGAVGSESTMPTASPVGTGAREPNDPNIRSTHIHHGGIGEVPPATPRPNLGEQVHVRRWRVRGTTGRREENGTPIVMYAGVLTRAPIGKEFSEAWADINHLRSQGVIFDEIVDMAAPPPPPPPPPPVVHTSVAPLTSPLPDDEEGMEEDEKAT